jgi:hypothetical protein
MTHYLAAGPRIHTLEGFVKAETVRFEYDVERGYYYGEFLWHESSEADEHLAAHGISNQPVCWLQIAYPTGYTSWLFGTLILFREVECRAMGAPHCRCIGQPVDAWGDNEDGAELQMLGQATAASAHGDHDDTQPVVGCQPASPAPGTCWNASRKRTPACRLPANPVRAKSCSLVPCTR